MQVSQTLSSEIQIRSMGAEDVRRVHEWMSRLANWDNDSFVRNNSRKLSKNDIQVLATPEDLNIYFTVDDVNKVITVFDILKRSVMETV